MSNKRRQNQRKKRKKNLVKDDVYRKHCAIIEKGKKLGYYVLCHFYSPDYEKIIPYYELIKECDRKVFFKGNMKSVKRFIIRMWTLKAFL